MYLSGDAAPLPTSGYIVGKVLFFLCVNNSRYQYVHTYVRGGRKERVDGFGNGLGDFFLWAWDKSKGEE